MLELIKDSLGSDRHRIVESKLELEEILASASTDCSTYVEINETLAGRVSTLQNDEKEYLADVLVTFNEKMVEGLADKTLRAVEKRKTNL